MPCELQFQNELLESRCESVLGAVTAIRSPMCGTKNINEGKQTWNFSYFPMCNCGRTDPISPDVLLPQKESRILNFLRHFNLAL